MQDRRLKIQIKTKNQQNRMLFVPVNFYQLPVNSRNCEKNSHTHKNEQNGEWCFPDWDYLKLNYAILFVIFLTIFLQPFLFFGVDLWVYVWI